MPPTAPITGSSNSKHGAGTFRTMDPLGTTSRGRPPPPQAPVVASRGAAAHAPTAVVATTTPTGPHAYVDPAMADVDRACRELAAQHQRELEAARTAALAHLPQLSRGDAVNRLVNDLVSFAAQQQREVLKQTSFAMKVSAAVEMRRATNRRLKDELRTLSAENEELRDRLEKPRSPGVSVDAVQGALRDQLDYAHDMEGRVARAEQRATAAVADAEQWKTLATERAQLVASLKDDVAAQQSRIRDLEAQLVGRAAAPFHAALPPAAPPSESTLGESTSSDDASPAASPSRAFNASTCSVQRHGTVMHELRELAAAFASIDRRQPSVHS